MSLASCSYQLGFVPDEPTFMACIRGVKGDLYQIFSGESNAPTIISTDWSAQQTLANRPCLRNVVMESDPDVSEEDIAALISDADTQYFVDGEQLMFDSKGVSIKGSAGYCQKYVGCFQKLSSKVGTTNYRADAPHGGLVVLNNLVTDSGGTSITVGVRCAIVNNGTGRYYNGFTTIRIIKSNGQSNFCNIFCDANDSFVLSNDHKQVVCKVDCWKAGVKATSIITKWYMIENGAWVLKKTAAGVNDNEFTVDVDMVSTFADVKVECYESDGTTFIASDIQTVCDSSDPYVLMPNPNPADGMFYQTGGPSEVVFSPYVVDINGNPGPACVYTFTVLDSVGNILNPASEGKNVATYAVKKEVAVNIGEGPIVNIAAYEKS